MSDTSLVSLASPLDHPEEQEVHLTLTRGCAESLLAVLYCTKGAASSYRSDVEPICTSLQELLGSTPRALHSRIRSGVVIMASRGERGEDRG